LVGRAQKLLLQKESSINHTQPSGHKSESANRRDRPEPRCRGQYQHIDTAAKQHDTGYEEAARVTKRSGPGVKNPYTNDEQCNGMDKLVLHRRLPTAELTGF